MATVEERFAARRLSDTSSERGYVVEGATDEANARAAVAAAAPLTVGAMKRDDVSVEEIRDGLYYATVRWAKDDGGATRKEDGDLAFSFETRGGSQRITQSLETVESYAASGDAPDYKGAINVTNTGVEGADIHAAVFNFNVTLYLDSLSSSYVQTLYRATACVNDATFTVTVESGTTLEFAAGECLFLGAAGSKRGDNPWELQLAFAASPNISDLTLGEITGIAKDGWDYLWIRYQEAEDTTAKTIIRKPLAAYVERVFRRANLTALTP